MTDTSTTSAPARATGSPTVPGGLVAAVAGPAALASSNLCFAILTADGQAEDTSDYLDLVGDRAVLVEAGSGLALLACLLIVPAVWAVVGRLSAGRARLASIGGWLMSSGYVMGVALSAEALVAVAVSRSDGSTAAYVDGVDHHMSPVALAMYAVFGLGALLGGIVLGVAMARSPEVPRWCGPALIVSEPVRVVGLLTGLDILTAAASVLIMVSFVGVLRRR